MAPPRKRITKLGQHLRAARESLGVGQKAFAAMNLVSDRTLSRWENGGVSPTQDQRHRILEVCDRVPADLYNAMADVLGIELAPAEPDPPLPSPVLVVQAPVAPSPSPAPVEPPRLEPVRPSVTELRTALDAIIYAAAEDRDVLPRHLRAFGVELLLGIERLGLGASEAARLVAMRERERGRARVPAGSEDPSAAES